MQNTIHILQISSILVTFALRYGVERLNRESGQNPEQYPLLYFPYRHSGGFRNSHCRTAGRRGIREKSENRPLRNKGASGLAQPAPQALHYNRGITVAILIEKQTQKSVMTFSHPLFINPYSPRDC